jgi:hypothetical protein
MIDLRTGPKPLAMRFYSWLLLLVLKHFGRWMITYTRKTAGRVIDPMEAYVTAQYSVGLHGLNLQMLCIPAQTRGPETQPMPMDLQ